MPFKKGEITNPAGRPKKTKEQYEFEKKCQTYLDKQGFIQIQEMAQEGDKASKRWALEVMLDRGFGRPTEIHDITNRDDIKPSFAEVEGEINDLLGEGPNKGIPGSQPPAGTA